MNPLDIARAAYIGCAHVHTFFPGPAWSGFRRTLSAAVVGHCSGASVDWAAITASAQKMVDRQRAMAGKTRRKDYRITKLRSVMDSALRG